MPLTLEPEGAGFTISTSSIYAGRYLGSDGYMDNLTAAVWVFDPVEGETTTYRLSDADGRYLSWDGKGHQTTSLGTDPGEGRALWQLITRQALIDNLHNASVDNPIDATFLICNPWFAKGNGINAGSGIDACIPYGWLGSLATDYWGYDTNTEEANYVVEQYGKPFDTYQIIDVPNGEYELRVQGFYRRNDGKEAIPVLYANDVWQPLRHIDSDSPAYRPFDITSAATALHTTSNYYTTAPVHIKVTDGKLRLGVKAGGRVDWCAFDNFTLTCLGTAPDSQDSPETFSVAALNVDGLPAKISFAFIERSINPDGPQSDGTTAISRKLADKGYDIIGVSEDFNFHNELRSALEEHYNVGTYRGKVSVSLPAIFSAIDTDGLCLFWKKGMDVGDESWTRWNSWNGKFDHGADGLIKKGFRHYTYTTPEDINVDIYILHMDAETGDDDITAREQQLIQLADALRTSDAHRPKIIMGDTNCRYTRDRLYELLNCNLYTTTDFNVKDAWVEYCRMGNYPPYGTDAQMVYDLGYSAGELVDKILFINPKEGPRLRLDHFYVDTEFNHEDGTPLADHYPVVAHFSVIPPAAPQPALSVEELALRPTTDATAAIINPSFEDEPNIGSAFNHDVIGWIVNPNAAEAFASECTDNGIRGQAIRDLAGRDGDKVFNTWSPNGNITGGFYCRQRIYLPAGYYRLSALLASDAGAIVYLEFGTARQAFTITTSRGHESTGAPGNSQYAEALFSHPGGEVTIGLWSASWFEADDFRLLRYDDHVTAINTPPAHRRSPRSPVTLTYIEGIPLSQPRRGINILRMPDGDIKKVLLP